MPRFVTEAAAGYGLTGAGTPVAGAGDPFAVPGKVGQSTGLEQKGILSTLGDFAKENPLTTAGLGLGALALGMTPEEEEELVSSAHSRRVRCLTSLLGRVRLAMCIN